MDMIPNMIAQRYRAVQVKTCAPGEIVVLLFEGAIRYLGESATAMRAGDRARAGERLNRAHAIVSELCSGLRPVHAPELCANLQSLYFFCMTQIVEANIHQDPERLDAVARILDPLRDAFTQVVRKNDANPAPGIDASRLQVHGI